jgi:hypothetical protein
MLKAMVFLVSLIGMVAHGIEVRAAVLIVDDDMVQCRNAEFTTPAGIQLAVNAASPGDTIRVCPGNYSATTVDKADLTLIGSTRALTVQQCFNAARFPAQNPQRDSIVNGDSSTSAFTVTAEGVTIQNFTAEDGVFGIGTSRLASGYVFRTNVIQNNSEGIRLRSDGQQLSEVLRNCVRNSTFVGVAGEQLSNAVISGNTITGPQSSMNVAGPPPPASGPPLPLPPANVTISRNIMDSNVALSDIREAQITRNHLFDRGAILLAREVSEVDVDRNRIENCFQGIVVGIFGQVYDNVVSRNSITECIDAGIIVSLAANNTVRFNLVRGNDDGVSLGFGATNTLVEANFATANRRDGLRATEGAVGNTFRSNLARFNAEHDCHDNSTGAGTAGTANTWVNNQGQTQNRPGLCTP